MKYSVIIIACIFSVSAAVATVATAQQTGPDIRGETQALQQQMMGNKEIMDLIMSLQNDPDIQKILQDPDIMKAVNSGDIATLMANPAFMRILNKKEVHEIGTKLQK